MHTYIKDKSVLITGACGTIGEGLIRQLLSNPDISPSNIIALDNNESKLFFDMQNYGKDPRIEYYICDIRDADELKERMSGINLVFHCAALKHVSLGEESPQQIVKTNIIGVQNVITAANANNVEKVIFTSSDKAVNPTNVMGTSKLMGERLITAANNKNNPGTIFSSTRFGNVLGSNGSVLPIFKQQILHGGPVTLTHNDMTRFVMSIEEAVNLVLDSICLAKGGEVFVTKMPVVSIRDLAEVMIEELAPGAGYRPEEIQIKEIGIKPGEKMYEELLNSEEASRAKELEKYFVIFPAFKNLLKIEDYEYREEYKSIEILPYISNKDSSSNKPEIKKILLDADLIQVKDAN